MYGNFDEPDSAEINLNGDTEADETLDKLVETETAPEEPAEDADIPETMEDAKPKRSRKKKESSEVSGEQEEQEVVRLDDISDEDEIVPADEPADIALADTLDSEASDLFSERAMLKIRNSSILSPEEEEEYNWHEVKSAYLSRRILKGTLSAVEKTDTDTSLAIIYYNSFRVVIPAKEFVELSAEDVQYGDINTRYSKILNGMIGCEVDFIIRGVENKTRSIVASRKAAMLRRKRAFYFNPQNDDLPKITEGQVVEARIIAVSDRSIRVEAFGAECSIKSMYLSWDWMNNANERYIVGETMLVRIQEITGETPEELYIKADAKSLTRDTNFEKLMEIKEQSKYSGVVTEVYKGIIFIRLHQGVNAIAHSCQDYRRPGRNDEVSVLVTHIDPDQKVAVGFITKIIKQNIR